MTEKLTAIERLFTLDPRGELMGEFPLLGSFFEAPQLEEADARLAADCIAFVRKHAVNDVLYGINTGRLFVNDNATLAEARTLAARIEEASK